jgi:4-hydroxyphenylpyruvate dioxygenase
MLFENLPPLPLSMPPRIESIPRFIHHVEIQTQSARLLAAALSTGLGMRIVLQLRTSRGISYVLQAGQAMIVCTALLPAGCSLAAIGAAESFHQSLRAMPITKVRLIGLQVSLPDVVAGRAIALAGQAGGTSPTLCPAGIELSRPDLLGDLALRFLDGPLLASETLPSGIPLGIPGFAPLAHDAEEPDAPGSIVGIDHVAITVPDVATVSGWLGSLLGWTHFRTFEERVLDRPLNAVTLGSPTSEGLLTIVQPTSADSVFRRALNANGGVGVHHIALRCSDVIRLVDHLARHHRWACMPPPSGDYYEAIRPTALEFLSESEFELMRRYGMLFDAAGDCALIQVFLPYLCDIPGVFFELIGRVPRRGGAKPAVVAPGCGGFGDGNVTRLYDCLVRAIDAPPHGC